MVLEAWGKPVGSIVSSDGSGEFLSYRVMFRVVVLTGQRSVVRLEGGRVTQIIPSNVFTASLDRIIGWTQSVIRFYFGEPNGAVETPDKVVWGYEAGGIAVAIVFSKPSLTVVDWTKARL
jgi:hypothetical protein